MLFYNPSLTHKGGGGGGGVGENMTGYSLHLVSYNLTIYSKPAKVILNEIQAISARERALCQLTLCFELQSIRKSMKGHKSCALPMVLRSKVQI